MKPAFLKALNEQKMTDIYHAVTQMAHIINEVCTRKQTQYEGQYSVNFMLKAIKKGN